MTTPYLVLGGELVATDKFVFRDPNKIDVVGIFPDYDSAVKAWRGKAQQTVDSCLTRYFVLDLNFTIAANQVE